MVGGKGEMKLSFVVSVQPTRFEAVAYEGELEKQLAFIAELGYQGVELAVRDPASLDVGNLKRLLQGYGLAVPAIGTGQAYIEEGLSLAHPSGEIRTRAIGRIKSHIDLARELGAMVIIGLIRGEEGGDEPRRLFVEALGECASYAAEKGVKLVLEPINRYETKLINTVEEGLAILDEIGSDVVGLLLDTFHANIEEPWVEDSVRKAGGKLFHVHIADSNRRFPGAGHFDFRSFLGSLRAIGYEGFLSAEILPWPDTNEAARRTMAFFRESFGQEI